MPRSMREVLHDFDRKHWKTRLVAALKDGLELEGSTTVHAAIKDAMAELKIAGTRGPRPEARLTPAARE